MAERYIRLNGNTLAVWKELMAAADGSHEGTASAYSTLGSWMAEYGPEIIEEIERLRPLIDELDEIEGVAAAAVRVYGTLKGMPDVALPFSLAKALTRLHWRVGQLSTKTADGLADGDGG